MQALKTTTQKMFYLTLTHLFLQHVKAKLYMSIYMQHVKKENELLRAKSKVFEMTQQTFRHKIDK